MRRAFSLLELIVCLAIVATMLAFSLPAIQRARAMAVRIACANNLRQIGLAIHSAYDGQGTLPHARECPFPWRDGNDKLCQTLPAPDTWTGPQERWWAPYDNRPGTSPTKALPGFLPESFLWEFAGKDARIFHCPLALDRTEGSPTRGQAFQLAYALNPAVGGKRLTDNETPWRFVWEHDDLPVCDGNHWTPWPASAEQKQERHWAARHVGTLNILARDGSVSASRP